jgi:hypothetical protein
MLEKGGQIYVFFRLLKNILKIDATFCFFPVLVLINEVWLLLVAKPFFIDFPVLLF